MVFISNVFVIKDEVHISRKTTKLLLKFFKLMANADGSINKNISSQKPFFLRFDVGKDWAKSMLRNVFERTKLNKNESNDNP